MADTTYMSTSTTYQITQRPKSHIGMMPDCNRCESEALKRPVYLSQNGQGAQAFGTHCAAVLLGLIDESASQGDARKALTKAVNEQQERDRVERIKAEMEYQATYQRYLDETGQQAGMEALKGFKAWQANDN